MSSLNLLNDDWIKLQSKAPQYFFHLYNLPSLTYYKLRLQDEKLNSSVSSWHRIVGDVVCIICACWSHGRKNLFQRFYCWHHYFPNTISCMCNWCVAYFNLLKLTIFELHNLFYFIGFGSLPPVITIDIYTTSFWDLGAITANVFHFKK